MDRLKTVLICIVAHLFCVNCGIISIVDQLNTYDAVGIVEKIPDSTADYGLCGTLKKQDRTKSVIEGTFRFSKNSRYNSPLYTDSLIKFTCDVYSKGTDDWETIISEVIRTPAM